MPWCLTSTARPAAKEDKNALVEAYKVVKGEQIVAAADEVKTIPPLLLDAICHEYSSSADGDNYHGAAAWCCLYAVNLA